MPEAKEITMRDTYMSPLVMTVERTAEQGNYDAGKYCLFPKKALHFKFSLRRDLA